jgi:23S rRNA methylase
MSRSKSSRRWLDRHFNDPYVKRVQIDGYRSRAAYKLLEIQEKDLILRPGMRVVDLGAAPGSWSQIASNLVGTDGLVVALDILPMEPLPGVIVLQGDFREDEVLRCLRAAIGEAPLDLVLSDMAPNLTGTAVVDQTRAMYLVELALDLARTHLSPAVRSLPRSSKARVATTTPVSCVRVSNRWSHASPSPRARRAVRCF